MDSSKETKMEIEQLFVDLSIDSDTAALAKKTFERMKEHYTLQGEQIHWVACSVYAASLMCKKTGTIIGLTELLRLSRTSLIEFIRKCKIWAEMISSDEMKQMIDDLEHRMGVTKVIYKKYIPIFQSLFRELNSDSTSSSPELTMPMLNEFCWTLFLAVKSQLCELNSDLVNSYHLLLTCCDFIYASVVKAGYKNIINPEYKGLEQDSDLIDKLCDRHHGVAAEVKNIKEYCWHVQIELLIKKKVFQTDEDGIHSVLKSKLYQRNYNSLKAHYDLYMKDVGDFDERLFMGENLVVTCNNDENKCNATKSLMSTTPQDSNYRTPPMLTPLTGKVYLRNVRDGNIKSLGDSPSPVKIALMNVTKLHSFLIGRQTSPSPALLELLNLFETDVVSYIKKCVDKNGDMYLAYYSNLAKSQKDGYSNNFASRQLELAKGLYYRFLEDILLREPQKSLYNLNTLLYEEIFHQTLLACCMELVVYSYGCSNLTFPWVLDALQIHPYHFYKIIEVVVRTETMLSRDLVKHLSAIEEQVLDSISWQKSSPLWENIIKSNLPIPSCEDVLLPAQLADSLNTPDVPERTNKKTNTPLMDRYPASNSSKIENNHTDAKLDIKSEPKESEKQEETRPKRVGSLGLFFRKFYNLASVRIQDLCSKLDIRDKGIKQKIWTCFEFVVVNKKELFRGRHLDHIIMCCVYVISRVMALDITFQRIIRCYREQPQASSRISKDVLLNVPDENESDGVEERGDVIQFYNQIFVRSIQGFALKFSNNQDCDLRLSPLPVLRPLCNRTPNKVLDNVPLYIHPFEKAISPSFQLPNGTPKKEESTTPRTVSETVRRLTERPRSLLKAAIPEENEDIMD